MKRILAILLALLMVFAVCACDKDDKKKDDEEESAKSYLGSLLGKGEDVYLTIDGDTATFTMKFLNRGGVNCQQEYSVTVTAPFTKDGERYVFDFTQEGAKALAKLSVTGEGAVDFLNVLMNLSYKSDPLYVDFCNGKEVEITTESAVWGAIGLPKEAIIQLNDNNTFTRIYE